MGKINATKEQVLEWLSLGHFMIDEGEVFSRHGRKLTARLNTRRGMEGGDLRVDLCLGKYRRSINVSHLVWMSHTNRCIPDDFEIHHKDEDISNNDWYNLICVFKEDHPKLHHDMFADESKDQEVPF